MSFPWKSLVLAMFFASFGCAGPASVKEERELRYYRAVPKGVLDTPGVEIEETDGTFHITEGPFYTPFQTTMWQIFNTPVYSDTDEKGRPHKHRLQSSRAWGLALAAGGQTVYVHVPATTKPLFGILVLNKVHKLAPGAGTKFYRIVLTPEHIHQALQGRIAVAYEYITYRNRNRYTWILWISKKKLW